MCGIASIVRKDEQPVDVGDLRRMCSAIAHRGPDDAGFAHLDRGRVGLGHVRLSIVDLAGGQQPLYNEDQTVAVICNGEIYDYARLHDELTRKGHRFRTSSDSELIVHLYEEHGDEFLQRLNGEFAFVLWDGRQRRLIAAKDPSGVKPLYYHVTANEVILCSEVKGIYALPRVERQLAPRYLSGPALGIYRNDVTPFANVHSLKPGHFLVIDSDGNHREHEYFRVRFEVREDMTFEEATAAIRERLTKSVQRRLAADVPIHAYLSGGIDSTIIAGLMTQLGAKFTCFNVGFPGTPYDESQKARTVAAHFGQNFESMPCDQEQIADNIAKAVYHTEMPLGNYNALAKMLLSGYVRGRGVKVCLTGEGADELFAGYPYFKLEMIWRKLAAGGAEAKQGLALQQKFRELEYRSEGLLWDGSERWKKAVKILGYPSFFHLRARDARNCVRNFFDTKRLGLTPNDMPEELLHTSVASKQREGLDPFNVSRLVTFNQLYNLVIPSLGDRVEMAHSLECRPPFLDRELVEFAGTIPPRHFIDLERLREKNLLRVAFADLMPPMFQKEHKHPFLAPAWSSFAKTRAGRPLFEEFLSYSALRKVGIFRPIAVTLARLVVNWCPLPRGFARKIDAMFGTILTTHLLHHQFIANRPASDVNFSIADRSPEQVGEQKLAA
jgi:asparagine synthase (glutamine-hydrolysing)